ncbi:muscarinic acetylcholine receptor M2 [Nothobranchius furzeri]|uniref:Muscarinic acetylcholine receptor n=1 Tax=Nothobranchius furzeri TaxID=105023 RepID=A0A8C6PM73_NOTFU|nr:muscarinic acetylcholine receptor M2 [Nothobranchius furzeri]XP_054589155.1 muscarinic acetylcholine receptor M2 [Nothobranchius furzeri]XP_054589157.1 muscarinic acetylcholine receptor M2 [Nothobranchius furzeri]KAF7224664.1 muscarinic acetylcholine receptor M2-like [Nothobranchius furzeri]
METLNDSQTTNITSSDHRGLFSVSPYTTVEIVLIILVAGSLSLITVIGNILVMLSIKVNRNLQTVNNYFLFSLACADLIIGICSMNLYTVYIVIGYWPLGAVVCDLWLAVDYVVSNASVMNLLIISFDRFFCVTKPLSYPARRSTKMAGLMIAAAWVLSFILWAPAILFWQFVVGKRTVPPDECYIQFFSNPAVTFGTAIAAFYLPVAIMIYLYWRISKASRSRMRKDSRKTSGTSLAEAPSNSQEEGCENNCEKTKQAEDEAGDEKERDMLQQQNGSGNYMEEKVDSTPEIVHPSTSKDPEAPSSSRKSSSGGKNKTQPSSPQNSAIDRQSMVAWTLLLVTKRAVSERVVAKWKSRGNSSRERKVTRTIMAILVAFVATWTPYNVMVLINTFCLVCIPNSLWTIGYWLCYINSTVNPACYALCNATFKNTFKHLLLCQYKNIRGR